MAVFHKELTEFDAQLESFRMPRWNELPSIELYMDQVVGIIDKSLAILAGDEQKVITPSMINNYVKMHAIPAPNKKKYTREQIADLMMICVLKQVLSIKRISTILAGAAPDLPHVYDEFCAAQESAFKTVEGGNFKFVVEVEDELNAIGMAACAVACKVYSEKIIKLRYAEHTPSDSKKESKKDAKKK